MRLPPATDRRAVAAVVAALCALTAAAAQTPHLERPFLRLAQDPAQTGDPVWSMPVDSAEVRAAAALIGPHDRWVLLTPKGPQYAQWSFDLGGGLRLLTLPALPVVHVRDADWAIGYAGARPAHFVRRIRLGTQLTAYRVRP